MSKEFAKLFTVKGGHQVLVTKDVDTKEERPEICVKTFIDGVFAEIKLGHSSDEACDGNFNAFNETDAEEMFKFFLKTLGKEGGDDGIL